MGKQKSAAAAGAVATGPVPRPPVLEHTTAELVSLIANLSEREDFTVDILGQAFALAQQRVGISVPGSTPTELPSTTDWTSIQASTACLDAADMGSIRRDHRVRGGHLVLQPSHAAPTADSCVEPPTKAPLAAQVCAGRPPRVRASPVSASVRPVGD